MKLTFFAIPVLLVLSTLSASPTLAATIYVPTDQPTILAGIDAAVGGDLVLVAPGTYIENIDFLGKAITVRGEAGTEATVIDGNEAGSVASFASEETEESVLEGFTLSNGKGVNGGGVFFGSNSSAKLIECVISQNTVDNYGGGIFSSFSSPTIMGCKIFGNHAQHSGGGLYVHESTLTLTNCLVVENTSENSGGGIFMEDSHSSTIVNCTISANNNAIVGGDGVECDGPSPVITNSIIWGNYFTEIWGGSHPPQISYSDIKGGWPGEGNIDADPLFVREDDLAHTGEWNFHLYLASPCVDSGTDVGVYTDLDGRTRPQRAGFDMGAYEYPDCIDGDGDGYGDSACGGHDCDDTAPDVNPGAEEICTGGIDDDCDGLADIEDLECGDILVPAQFSTIQEGIDAAPEGSVVLVAPGTYVENITFQGKAITLRGEAGAEATVIDGNQNGVVVRFEWAETAESVLDGFTITNGSSGGIYCGEMTSPVIRNCIITRNQTGGDGAGIYCHLSYPTILNCLIKENWTQHKYYGDGAGIYIGGGLATIKNSTIIGNMTGSWGNGAGIYCKDSSLDIEDSAILENIAGDYGGGIRLWDCWDPPSRINRCTISGNFCGERGGGMYSNHSWYVTVENCIITDNTAVDYGGGIGSYASPELTLKSSIISGNQILEYDGGGIGLRGSGDSHIVNCIITGNSSEWRGGGIMLRDSSGPTTIENCTIAWNTAETLGGGIYSGEIYSTITNSIIWGNSAPEGPSIGILGRTVTARYSDVQGGEEAVYVDHMGGAIWQEGMIDADPLFLGEEDYRLSHGSPCIDAGNPDPSYYDVYFPPSLGVLRNDMGAYGGPGASAWCGDNDGDGHESVVCGGDDCNDSYAAAYPGAEEICDGQDNDCDGIVPVDETDVDGDGWLGCLSDCDDSDPQINPFAEEICDGRDNECSGVIDDRDMDGDGHIDEACGGQDCDDSDPIFYPDAPELCDGLDNNCDGFLRIVERDMDLDGWMICQGDCDDTNPLISPVGYELCDAVDRDCTGDPFDKDADGDGYIDEACGGEDCYDLYAHAHPGAEEICEGLDTDCSGVLPVDEADDDLDGWMICEGDCEDTDPIMNPGLDEICADGRDNDCNGLADGEEWTLCPLVEIEASYQESILQLDFTLATPESAIWSTLMILTSPTFQIIPLWSFRIVALGPPLVTIISFPFPGSGWVGIYSALETDGGDLGFDFKWVDTN